MNDRHLSFLGLCKRAGKLATGLNRSVEAVTGGRSFVVIISTDASDRTKSVSARAAEEMGVPVIEYGLMSDIGRAIGEKDTAVVAVCDENMAKKLIASIGEQGGTD